MTGEILAMPGDKLTREQADALAAEAVTLQFLPAS